MEGAPEAAPSMLVRGRSVPNPAVLDSPGWTRTNNPPVNSRMLCQLSYRGTAEKF